jgi:hypothetical protein
MAQSEERKLYMRNLRKNNRPRFNSYYRDYYKKNKATLPCFAKRRGQGHGAYKSRNDFGASFERRALELLRGAVHTNENQECHKPWDIEWNGKTVDVKVRHPVWTFNLPKPGQCDLLLLYCLDERGEIAKLLLIPKEAQRQSIIISPTNHTYDNHEIQPDKTI